jgi:hypothetical protein
LINRKPNLWKPALAIALGITVLVALVAIRAWRYQALLLSSGTLRLEFLVSLLSFYSASLMCSFSALWLFSLWRRRRVSRMGAIGLQLLSTMGCAFVPVLAAMVASLYGTTTGSRLYSGEDGLTPILVSMFTLAFGVISAIVLTAFLLKRPTA